MIYDKLPILLLSTIAVEKNESVNSNIARCILENPSYIQTLGIKDMAAYCHVGISTLSRFCRAIGLEDFFELRELIQNTDFNKNTLDTSLENHVEQVKTSIDLVGNSVSEQDLKMLCTDLKSYTNIAAFGLLKAMSAAISFQTDMCMLNKPVYTNLSFPEQLHYIENAPADSLILLFSYTGSYFDIRSDRLNLPNPSPKIWMICGQEPEKVPTGCNVLRFASNGDKSGHPYQLLMVAEIIVQYYQKLYFQK